jgi:hypothetical protein
MVVEREKLIEKNVIMTEIRITNPRGNQRSGAVAFSCAEFGVEFMPALR